MIEHISSIINRVMNSATLAKIENKVIAKYESILPKKEEEKKGEDIVVEEIK